MITTWKLLFPINGINLLCARRLATPQDSTISKLKRNIEKSILPPKPKKPLNAFMQYFLSVKDKLHKDYPNYTQKELLKKVAEQWTQVESGVKENLQKQYMEQLSVYKQKLMDYKNSITDDQQMLIKKELIKKEHALERSQVKQKLAELGKPKRPLSAFLLFMQNNRKDSQVSQQDWMKILSTEWKNLTMEAKNKYIVEAAQLTEKYKTEVKKWEENMIRTGHQDMLKSTLKSKRDTDIDFTNVKTRNKENVKTGWGTDIQYLQENISDANRSDQGYKSTTSLVLYNDKNNLRDIMKYSGNTTTDAVINNVNESTVQPHESRTQMHKYFASAWQRFLTVVKERSKNWKMKFTLTQVD
ncbi:transcription factor A, mitochondrial isoform X2 [Nylanderia fulva]|uniref:transcription factor A, mitochondrial isoform X2 n=1 Tax=Nylanderia fulva TaxID=613905 RepID=UPI0010FB41B3|nr:transcription factor A, mitochondrial isoform X2 [Nylanderia fulva]